MKNSGFSIAMLVYQGISSLVFSPCSRLSRWPRYAEMARRARQSLRATAAGRPPEPCPRDDVQWEMLGK